MPRNRDRDRANLGEQADMSNTDIEREDRSMVGGAQGDRTAGNEGIDDPAMSRTHRESMRTDSSERRGRASSSDMARVSRTKRQSHDSSTDESESENPEV